MNYSSVVETPEAPHAKGWAWVRRRFVPNIHYIFTSVQHQNRLANGVLSNPAGNPNPTYPEGHREPSGKEGTQGQIDEVHFALGQVEACVGAM